MVTVTTTVRVKIRNPETRDVLLTSNHAQKIVNSYTDNWQKVSDIFMYYNPLISYCPDQNLFYITYELVDEDNIVNAELFIALSCDKQITINKKKYELQVELM